VAVVIALLGGNIFKTVQTQTALRSTTGVVMETLRTARERTLAAINDNQYGVHFDSDRLVLFEGDSYNALDPSNRIIDLDPALEHADITLTGGGSEVVFEKITGVSEQAGTVTLRLKNEPATSEVIQVLPNGQVQTSAVALVTTERVADSRHVHLSLGWSIIGATTLTLVFQEPSLPDVTYDIGMAPYFTVAPDSFSWEESLIAYSSPQNLKIDTHSLDAFNTVLNIHRDQRYNTKAVTIKIDGKEIVSFDAAGQATGGLFGGTMTNQ
jgi:hypothetical protein